MPAHKLIPQPNDGENLVCTRCRLTKPYSEFYTTSEKDANYKTYGGYSMPCRSCHKTISKARTTTDEYRQRIRTKRATDKAYRENINAQRLAAYHANRESVSLKLKAKRASRTPEQKEADSVKRRSKLTTEQKLKNSVWLKAWRSTPKGKAIKSSSNRTRKVRKMGIDAKLTNSQWLEALYVYGRNCIYCGTDCVNPTIDHVVPLSKGGDHTLENVVPACSLCNTQKFNHPVDTFLYRYSHDRGAFLIKRLSGLAQLVI